MGSGSRGSSLPGNSRYYARVDYYYWYVLVLFLCFFYCLQFFMDLDSILYNGLQNGNFQSKPKTQIPKDKHCATVSNPGAAESVYCPDDAMPEPSKIDYLDEGSIPAIPPDDVIDFSSLEFDDSIPTDPTFDLPVNDEPANLIGTSHSDAAIPGEHPETVPEISANV